MASETPRATRTSDGLEDKCILECSANSLKRRRNVIACLHACVRVHAVTNLLELAAFVVFVLLCQ